MPPELGNLVNLVLLYVGANELSGEIPAELGNLVNLVQLDLFQNSLSGAIPPELGGLAKLQWLSLRDNRLSGEVPLELGNLASLKQLNINGNQLTGSLPLSLAQLTTLEGFAFGDNAGLCASTDAAFQGWLTAIPNNRLRRAGITPLGPNCGAAGAVIVGTYDDVLVQYRTKRSSTRCGGTWEATVRPRGTPHLRHLRPWGLEFQHFEPVPGPKVSMFKVGLFGKVTELKMDLPESRAGVESPRAHPGQAPWCRDELASEALPVSDILKAAA